MLLDAVVERTYQAGMAGPVVNLDDSLVDVGTQHLAMVVDAAVVVQEEVVRAHQPVELEPLEQIARVDGEVCSGPSTSCRPRRHPGFHTTSERNGPSPIKTAPLCPTG